MAAADVVMSMNGTAIEGFDAAQYAKALEEAGYPQKADPDRVDFIRIVSI